MASQEELADRGEAAAAFESVLAAERAAEEAVAACRDEAARRLAAAREQAHALSIEVDARAQKWRTRSAARVAAQVADIEQQAARAAGPVILDATAGARIAAAVARLADELTGL